MDGSKVMIALKISQVTTMPLKTTILGTDDSSDNMLSLGDELLHVTT